MRSRVVEERKRERERSQCMRNDALLSFPWNRHPPPFPFLSREQLRGRGERGNYSANAISCDDGEN